MILSRMASVGKAYNRTAFLKVILYKMILSRMTLSRIKFDRMIFIRTSYAIRQELEWYSGEWH